MCLVSELLRPPRLTILTSAPLSESDSSVSLSTWIDQESDSNLSNKAASESLGYLIYHPGYYDLTALSLQYFVKYFWGVFFLFFYLLLSCSSPSLLSP